MKAHPIKVLHVFHGRNLNNGVDRTTLTLATRLLELGAKPHAVVPGEGEVTRALSELGITWDILPLTCCSGPAWQAQLRYLRESGERSKQLETLLNREKFDIVHLNTGHLLDAALAAFNARIPVIWHIHGPFEIDYQRYADFLSIQGYAWILKELGSQVIAVSDEIRDNLLTYLPPQRVRTVYNGIDIKNLARKANDGNGNIREELGLQGTARLVLGVGRISQQKDFATFVRVAEYVAKQYPNVYFAIAGSQYDVRLVEDLKAQVQVASLGDRVFLLGERDDVPRLMAQSDLLLSTSIYEGHPLVFLEMMALERPVVAMACVGLRDCIQNELNGLVVPLGDMEAAASAVLRMLDDAGSAQRLGKAGRKTVQQRFSSHNYVQQFLAVAQEAVAYGPSRIAPEVIDLIQGLLGEIGRASRRINELDVPRGIRGQIVHWAHRTLAVMRKHQE